MFMGDLILKYFSDLPTQNDFVERNDFSPPAELDKILDLEKVLGIKLPNDYIDFLLITNGYSGKLGQSNVHFIGIEKIEEYTLAYGGEFFPWIVFIGTDGGNEMYVIDKRNEKLQFGLLPYIGEDKDFMLLGDTFEEFIKHLYYNDFWGEIKTTPDTI